MAVEVSDLKVQIEKAKESLKSVDENIKKITGRDPNEPRPGAEGLRLSAGGPHVRDFGTVLGRRNRDVQERGKDSEPPRKRVAVFNRLGLAAGGRRVVLTGRRTSKHEEVNDEDDGEEQATKPAIQSSVVSTAKQITKNELISAQNVGEKGKARNRRMFGMLLGTLATFDKDSRGRQSKQAQKQKEVETRLEEETAEERRKLASQRRTLFNERRSQQRRIQLLEQKIALADELTEWETEWNKKSNFIMTKASPSIFFMPKDFTPRTQRALQDSKGRIKEKIEKHKKSVEETMNGYDDEIIILEGKQDNEDGKGDTNFRANNFGSRVVNSRKRGVNQEEPEEEMDLDSMEPQVDIKVEIDENEAEEGGNDRVSNGVLSTEIDAPHPDNQNHDIAMEEGKADRAQESKDHQQIILKQEAPSATADDAAGKEADDKPNNEPVEKPEVMLVDTERNVVAGRTGEEQQEEQVQNKQEEDFPTDVGDQKQESCSETEKGTASAKPGEEGCDDPGQDSLREKRVNEEKMVETTEHAKSEESDCEGDTERSSEKQTDKSNKTTSETLPTAKMEKDTSEKTQSTQDHSSSSSSGDSENDVKLKSSTEANLKKKSKSVSDEGGRTARRKQSPEQRSTEISLSADLRKSKNKEKESRTKRAKPRISSSEDSSSEEEQVKRKEKEQVSRKGSASERKARIRKRKSETSSENESSSDSSSSASSENARRKKRQSESRRESKRRSREKQVSRRSSGSSRRKSRSKSRERQTKRSDRHRR